jgi:hypothetical protein
VPARTRGPAAAVARPGLLDRRWRLAADLDLDIAVEMLWGPLRTRWLQRDGPLNPAFTDAVVETALNGLRPR